MRFRNNFENSKGVSLIEILIGATLGVLVLGAVISIYIKEDEDISRENEETDIGAKGRDLIKFLA
jgi:Tfp pilus assembly protein PilW